MQIEIRNRICYFFLLSLFLIKNGNAQDISVYINNVDSLQRSQQKDLVFDVNGEICSMIILRSELSGLKFYSNLGIEEIRKIKNNEYRIWIQNSATDIKIYIPGFPLFEYTLPHSKYKYAVYILSLEATKSDKVILQDTTQQILSFVTYPENAKILLNGTKIGNSPLIINSPDFKTFDYLIKKRGYSSVDAKDSMDLKTKIISATLDDLSKTKRYFVLLNLKWDGRSRSQIDANGMKGVTFGVFGKTGYYGSVHYLSVTVPAESYDFPNINDDYFSYNKGQKISLTSGISQQLGKSVFIYGGPGYIRRTYQREDSPDGKSQSLVLNTGIIFRIGWYSLFQIDFSPGINNTYTSFGIGLGINLPKSAKNSGYSSN